MRHFSKGLVSLVLLLAITYAFGKFQGGFVSWFIFYTFLPLAALALIQYFFGLSRVTVERKLDRSRGRAGDLIEVKLIIHNPLRLPIFYLLLTEQIPTVHGKHGSSLKLIAYPWFRRTTVVTYTLGPLVRGVYRWETIELATGDLFGLLKRVKTLEVKQKLSVYPDYKEIETWEAVVGGEQRKVLSNPIVTGDESSFVMGVRDYVAGDRLTQIHWKASARSGSLKSKEFEQLTSHEVMLCLNRELKAYNDDSLFEHAVTVTASLAHYTAKYHLPCGLISAGATQTVIPLERKREHIDRIFEHLVHVRADAALPISEILANEAIHLPRGTTLALITPRVDEPLLRVLNHLAYRTIRSEIFLIGQPIFSSGEKRKPGVSSREGSASLVNQVGITQLRRQGIPVHRISLGEVPSRLARSDSYGIKAL